MATKPKQPTIRKYADLLQKSIDEVMAIAHKDGEADETAIPALIEALKRKVELLEGKAKTVVVKDDEKPEAP